MTRQQFKTEKINDALAKSNGDRKLAAQFLECTPDQLKTDIRNSPALRARWAGRRAVFRGPLDTINRDVANFNTSHLQGNGKVVQMDKAPETPSLDQSSLSIRDLELDKAFCGEDKKVKAGFPRMGMSDLELAIAMEMQQCGQGWFRESVQLISGGATRTSIFIQLELDSIKRRLADVRTKLAIDPGSNGAHGDDREGWVKEELGLMKALVDVGLLSKGMMEMGFKAALIQATIEKNGVEKMKRPKPGFVVDVKQ